MNLFRVLAVSVAVLAAGGCTSNQARLADAYAPPLEARADCLARAPEGAGAYRPPHLESQPVWCRDAREQTSIDLSARETMPAPDFRRERVPEDD